MSADLSSSSGSPRLLFAIPLLIGLLFAFVHIEPRIYFENHNEAGSKYFGDTLQHLIGLNYFVQDEWRFPLLDVADLSFSEGGGNVIYTDSLPLLAIPAKLWYQVHPVLPDYFGFWLLVCLVLQPVAFCWVLRQAGRLNLRTAVPGSILALAIPAFLARWAHISLCSHFLILFAFGAYLIGRRRPLKGSLLLGLLVLISLLVTAYLFAMVFGFFAVHLAQSWQSGQKSFRRAAAEGGAVMGVVLLLSWVLGYWAVGRHSVPASGYGYFSMNLLSPFWPQNSLFFAGSGPSPDATGGQYEGMNYLGLGLLSGLALLFVRRRKAIGVRCREHPWLLAYMIFLCAFAVSHIVYLGSIKLFEVPLPAGYHFLSQFRSSGRMFWPVAYGLALLLVIELSRWRGGWRMALPAVVLVQAIDVWPYAGSTGFSGELSPEETQRQAKWSELLALHERLYLLPVFHRLPAPFRSPHLDLQHLASVESIPVSSAYMSRWFSSESYIEADFQTLTGPFDEGGLYVLVPPVMTASDALARFPEGVAVREFDGLIIVSGRLQNSPILHDLRGVQAPRFRLGTVETFQAGTESLRLLYGEITIEDGTIWTDVRKAGILGRIPAPGESDLVFRFNAATFVPPQLEKRILRLSANGNELGQFEIDSGQAGFRERMIRIPHELIGQSGELQIEWSFGEAPTPAELGIGSDTRRLGLKLAEFSLELPSAGPRTLDAQELGFSRTDLPDSIRFGRGIAGAEAWGRWTNGPVAELEFQVNPMAGFVSIDFQCFAFLAKDHVSQRVRVFINGQPKAVWEFDALHNEALRAVELNANEIPPSGLLEFHLEIEQPRSPADLGLSADARQLGIGIRSVRVETISTRGST